jgi:zeaxanthin glucosyltransferase
MRIAFFPLAAPGHLNPMTTLARKLQLRGHDVVIISRPDAEPFVRAAHLPFIPCCETDYLPGSLTEFFGNLGRLQGEDGMRLAFGALASSTESLFNYFPATLAAAGVDGVVLDSYQPYAELVPMHMGMPFVRVSNALHIDYSGNTPPCLFDWPHKTDTDALARNREGVVRFRKILEPAIVAAKKYAKKVGLSDDWNNPDASSSTLAHLTQTPKEFDFNGVQWPTQFHHTGPFHDGAGRIDVEFPWERLTGEPLVYASMGTLQNGLPHVFRAITGGAMAHKQLQFVISLGSQLDPEQIGPVPDNAIIVRNAPQLKLLKRASLCITHAGLNTTLESLAQGVPLVAIPVTNDQPGVAARIAHKKVGLYVPSTRVTASCLSALIDEVMNDFCYRDNARRLQRAIIKNDGLSVAADLLEKAFGLTAK